MIARRPWLGISPADDRIKSETPHRLNGTAIHTVRVDKANERRWPTNQ